MSKYLSAESWEPSNGFIATKTSEKIIKEKQRNLAILAGPGAGKTEILAQRANLLLQTGACKAPQKILALSFKVDAAANMKNRVDLRCGRELARRFDSSTFDAFFISLARRFYPLLPDWVEMPTDFDVYPFDRNWWDDYEQSELGGQPCKYKSTFINPALHSPLDLSEEPDEADEENEASEPEIDGDLPRGGLVVAGSENADHEKGRDEGELVEGVEEKDIGGAEGSEGARGDE